METAKETPTSELREMAKGSLVKAPSVKDRDGKEWTLLPLDLSDIVDYEESVGASLFSESLGQIHAKEIMFLMYLSLRKTGCTEADLEAKKYAFPGYRAFLRRFDVGAFVASVMTLPALLQMSGLDQEKSAENPQKADQ